MNHSTSKSLETSIVFYALIVLFCMNFLGKGSIFCLAFSLFAIFFQQSNISIDRCGIYTIIFSALTAFSSLIYYNFQETVKCLIFSMIYIVGYSSLKNAKAKNKYIERAMFCVFLGYSTITTLTYFFNINDVYVQGQRLTKNIWSGDYIAVTLIGLLTSVVIGYFFYSLFFQKNKGIKALGIFAMSIALLINAQTATRTPIILFIITAFFLFLIFLFSKKGIRAINTLLIILLICLFGILLYGFDFLGVRTFIESTPLFSRFIEEGIETTRLQIFKEHFLYATQFPWGGENIHRSTGNNAHNLLQQGYDLFGIFATIPLFLIYIDFIKTTICLCKAKNKTSVDYLFISMYIPMIIQSTLEPIFTGYPCYLFTLLFIHGISKRYLVERDRIIHENH